MGDSNLDIFGGQGDPFQDLNPFKGADPFGGRGGGYGRRAAPKYPPLDPAEAEPLKQGLLDRTVSGLHWVGSTLDKTFGGRAVRGVLGGKPHELLSAIPFSDTLGLTDPKDSVSGADLLKNAGIDTAKGNWFQRNILPAAVEIGLDPGSYINPFGAATKLGKVATGLGHTQGWSRKALTEGFTHLAPELRAAGKSAGEIAHLGNQGARIASDDVIKAALDKGIDLKAGMPLRGSLGVGLPFREPTWTVGTGARSKQLAGLMDQGVAALKTAPGVPHLRAWFDPAVMRATHPGVQAAAEMAGRPAHEAVAAATRGTEYTLRAELDDLLKGYQAMPGAENEALRLIGALAEDASPHYTDAALWSRDLDRRFHTLVPDATSATGTRRLATGVTDVDAVRNHLIKNWAALQGMGGRIRQFGRDTLDQAGHLGLNAEDLDDVFAHYAARRYIGAAPGFGGSQLAKQFPTLHGSNLRRSTVLRDIPGGSAQLNEWAVHPELSGSGRTLSHADVANRVYADMERHIQAMYPNPTLITPLQSVKLAAELKSARGKAGQVAHWLGAVPDVHAANAVPYFSPDVIGDLAMRGQRHARVAGSAESLLRGGVDMARPIADLAGDPHAVPLGDFVNKGGRSGLQSTLGPARLTEAEALSLSSAGFRDAQHLRTVASNPAIASPAEQAALATISPALQAKLQKDVWSGAALRAYEQMAKRGFGSVEDLAKAGTSPIDELNKFGLSSADAQALSRHLQGWAAPTEAKPFLDFVRKSQDVFKNLVYPIWPASHVRNLAGALYNNALHGTGLGDYADAWRIMRSGRVADPARYAGLAGLTPEAAARELNRGAYAHGKVYTGVNQFTENVGGRGLADERLSAGLRGEHRLVPRAPGAAAEGTLGERAWAALTAPGGLNPLGQAGLGGGVVDKLLRTGRTAARTEDTFALLKGGRAVGTGVEDFARLSNYLGNLRQGMSPDRAGQLTRKVHFDYQDLTPTEQAIKNFVPFYTFARKNLPYQANMALTQPNKVLPALHAMGATDPDAPWVPDYLASGAALPVGQEQGGTQRFLSKFGLPLEEAAERFKFRNVDRPGGGTANLPSVGGTGMAFLGMANPYLKGPLEYLTDTQFHTGRRLSDLHSKGIAGGFGVVPEEIAQPLTQLVANSPLARLASSLNTLADDRKGVGAKLLNLGTGLRLTDVDLDKQRAIAARSELESQLRIDPRIAEFTNYYGRPGASLPPELVERLRLFSTFKADAKAYHQERAKAEQLRALHGGLRPGL